jgi:hypothetical protein
VEAEDVDTGIEGRGVDGQAVRLGVANNVDATAGYVVELCSVDVEVGLN